jgi:hypothetical protein
LEIFSKVKDVHALRPNRPIPRYIPRNPYVRQDVHVNIFEMFVIVKIFTL